MADLKISGLPASTTPLAGTEVLPIVQSSTTKQVSVANLTAGRAVGAASLTATGNVKADTMDVGTSYLQFTWDTGIGIIQGYSGKDVVIRTNGSGTNVLRVGSADVTVCAGNLVQGTAAKGINFTANTPAAGKTSQLLNWYEEGTWTPTVRGDGTAGTYELDAVTNCTYTRTGRVVTLNAYIRLASSVTGGGTGSMIITGLPWSKAANTMPVGDCYLALGSWSGNHPTVVFGSFLASAQLYFQQDASGGYGTNIPISYASANAYIGLTIVYTV